MDNVSLPFKQKAGNNAAAIQSMQGGPPALGSLSHPKGGMGPFSVEMGPFASGRLGPNFATWVPGHQPFFKPILPKCMFFFFFSKRALLIFA